MEGTPLGPHFYNMTPEESTNTQKLILQWKWNKMDQDNQLRRLGHTSFRNRTHTNRYLDA